MILILSDDQFQSSIDEIILWIHTLKGDYVRLNEFSPKNYTYLKIDFNEDAIYFEGTKIDFESINVIWHYRFGSKEQEEPRLKLNSELGGVEENVFHQLNKTNDTVSQYFFTKIANKVWFNLPRHSKVNKLHVLNTAIKIGLKIPKSLISTNKKELKDFIIENNENVITKPIWEVFSFSKNNTLYSSYTSTVRSNDSFFNDREDCLPTLIQENVDKRFEIRTFFIDGRFYSMAIFSQESDQTKNDFRVYDRHRPNRTIPYKLPEMIENKLSRLMTELQLKTGSIDLIYTWSNEHVFLEINPVGQFAMTSKPCNYYLERKIAETLIKYDKKS